MFQLLKLIFGYIAPFTIEIMAAVAAQERRLISRRTKEALAAAKARGVKLGGYRHDGSISKAEALDRAEALRPVLAELADLSLGLRRRRSTIAASRLPRVNPGMGCGGAGAQAPGAVIDRLRQTSAIDPCPIGIEHG
jgi:hypothetical protein